MRIDITDASASQIDIGRLIAGPVWRLTRAFAYGVQEGRLVLDIEAVLAVIVLLLLIGDPGRSDENLP